MKRLLTLCALIVGLTTQAQIPPYVPTDGLVGWWPFNGDANDESGNGNNGVVNGATLTEDRFGNVNSAFLFSVSGSGGWGAAQDRIVISNPTIPDVNSFTMSSWIIIDEKPSPFDNRPHTIFGRWDGNGEAVFRHLINYSGEISTNVNGVEIVESNSSLNYSQWYHVTISYDGDVLSHYLNGELVGEFSIGGQIAYSTTDLTFGELHMANGHWYLFNGKMDELGYWDRALTEEEVQGLYEAQTEVCGVDDAIVVETYSYAYDPSDLSIDVGETISWINTGGFHDVNGVASTLGGQSFNNPESFYISPASGSSSNPSCIGSYTFNTPGVYEYDCSIGNHAQQGMVATITVGSPGCNDESACNYDANADFDDGSCIFPVGCDTCSGETDGTGVVVDNDADNDGVCDNDEIVGCQDETACNYNILATDSGNCIFTEGVCDTCSGETDGTGVVVDNDTDNDGVCDNDEIVGCQDEMACNYDSAATDSGNCIFPEDICETCSGETDGTGVVVDNDTDNDGVCDDDEIEGCQDQAACNYNMFATDTGACIFPDDICETCSGQQDGTGTIVDNDADNDGVCDNDEIVGCQDEMACNYDSSATDAGDCEYVDTFNIAGDIAPVVLNQTYTYTMTMGSTYAWTCTGGTIESGDGTNTIDVLWTEAGVGELCVTETNADGCVGDEVCLEVEIILTNLNEEMISSINIFPNPASTSVTITIDEALINASYQLFDTQGKLVSEGVLTKTDTTLNTTGFASGNYVVSISNNQGTVRQQIIIER